MEPPPKECEYQLEHVMATSEFFEKWKIKIISLIRPICNSVLLGIGISIVLWVPIALGVVNIEEKQKYKIQFMKANTKFLKRKVRQLKEKIRVLESNAD